MMSKEGNSTGLGAEAAGYLLLDLGEADITLSLVVVKGNGKILGKQADMSLEFARTVQKPNRFAPLRLSVFGLRRTLGMLTVSLVQEIVVLLLEALQNIIWESRDTLQHEFFLLALHILE